jgi:membrane fusion protein (multidrug efflux system)
MSRDSRQKSEIRDPNADRHKNSEIMRRIHWLILTMLAAAGAAGLTGCKSGGGDEDEKIVTEVAVQVGKVTRADLKGRVEAFGMVEPEPAQAGRPGGGTKLAAPVAGVVLEVPATEGKQVKAGELVVRLDDRVAQAAVDKANEAVTYAEQLVARQEKLKKVDGTSEKAAQEADQQLASARAELKSAQAALALVQLRSPLDGAVARINVQPGQAVDLNMVAAEIVDVNRLVVSAEVPAAEAARLKPDQSAEIFTEGKEEAVTVGRVTFVSPSVDPKSGTVVVRVALPKETSLRPGQFVRAQIVAEVHAGRLAVPRDSVVKSDEGQVIYVVEGDQAKQKAVKVGLVDGPLAEIEGEGIQEGDTVVTVGAYGLPKETKVKVIGQ